MLSRLLPPSVVLALLALTATAPQARAGDKPLRQVIDDEIQRAWKREKVTPAPRCDDATFLRRTYLDLTGVVPSLEETQQFLKDADPQKRAKLIDRLLADPRFSRQQADVWDLVLFGRHPG